MLERALHWFGYGFAHLLFVRAHSPEAVVRRLRLAYRLVGVRIVETPRVDGTERTIFRCPYRNLAAGRWGPTWLCHEKLDRVDDGYVTFLRRHRDIEYDRPRSCTNLAYCEASAHCYSDVSAAGSADTSSARNTGTDNPNARNTGTDNPNARNTGTDTPIAGDTGTDTPNAGDVITGGSTPEQTGSTVDTTEAVTGGRDE